MVIFVHGHHQGLVTGRYYWKPEVVVDYYYKSSR